MFLFTFIITFLLFCKSNNKFDGKKLNKSKVMRKKALRYVFSNQYDSALLYFDSSLYYNPEYSEAYAGKSLIYLGQKNHKKAMNNINLALKYDPDNLDWHFNKAHILYEKGEYDSASKKFHNILGKADKKWLLRKSYYKLGLIELYQKDTTQAIEHFYNSSKFGHTKADSIYNKLKHSGN
jgi:Tfp pilus assembly protein PilF